MRMNISLFLTLKYLLGSAEHYLCLHDLYLSISLDSSSIDWNHCKRLELESSSQVQQSSTLSRRSPTMRYWNPCKLLSNKWQGLHQCLQELRLLYAWRKCTGLQVEYCTRTNQSQWSEWRKLDCYCSSGRCQFLSHRCWVSFRASELFEPLTHFPNLIWSEVWQVDRIRTASCSTGNLCSSGQACHILYQIRVHFHI